MSDKKTVTTPASNTSSLFGKQNYIWIIGGIVVMLLGLVLMSGGNSKDPNVFNENEVYSKTRITVAPILILLGLAMEVYAIFKKPKA